MLCDVIYKGSKLTSCSFSFISGANQVDKTLHSYQNQVIKSAPYCLDKLGHWTVNVRNRNVWIQALFEIVRSSNRLDFKQRLKSKRFRSDVQFVNLASLRFVWFTKLNHCMYKKWSSLVLKISLFGLDQGLECPKSEHKFVQYSDVYCTVDVRKRNVWFDKPNKIVICLYDRSV